MSSYEVEEAESHEESVRICGRVKWFDVGKGYGFIVPDDPSQTGLKDVLLHVTSLRQSGHENAPEGSLITCEVVKRPKGWQVSEIVELDETTASPAERPHRPSDRDNGFRRDRASTASAARLAAVSAIARPVGRRRPRVRSSAPRSSGSTAPRAMASSFATVNPATSSCTSRPCAAVGWKIFSPARTSWSASPKGPRAWWWRKSRPTSRRP